MKRIIDKLLKISKNPELGVLAGNMAYALMVSIVPILSIILIICSNINLSSVEVVSRLENIIPKSFLSILLPYLETSTFSNVLLIVLGIWTASVGADNFIISANTIYGLKNAPYVTRKIKSFLLTLLLVLMVIISLFGLVYGDELIKFVLDFIGFNYNILVVFTIIKWPISIVIIYIIIKSLYLLAPDTNIKYSSVNKGSLFTTILWILASSIYAYYATNIANYSKFYGGLANIVVLLIWLYISSYILVFGMYINREKYNA